MSERVITRSCIIQKRLLWTQRLYKLLDYAKRHSLPWERRNFGHWKGYAYKNLSPSGIFRGDLEICQSLLPFPAKCWRILRLEEGAAVPSYQQVAGKDKKVHTLHLLIEPPSIGGILKINFQEIYLTPGDAVVFNASKQLQSISRPVRGSLYLLSLQTEAEVFDVPRKMESKQG